MPSAPPALSRRIALAALLAATPLAAQEYPFGSTADTVFDIIRTDDPTAFVCLSYEGRTTRQMWDKRIDGESDLNVFLFQAHFSDGPPVDIILNPEFGSEGEARAEAMRYVRGLGQLPLVFRQGIRQFGVHKGDKGFHGGPGKIFMYHDRATRRIEQAHLEESILHESVHASLDRDWRQSPQWRAAQAKDPGFLTRYAAARTWPRPRSLPMPCCATRVAFRQSTAPPSSRGFRRASPWWRKSSHPARYPLPPRNRLNPAVHDG